MIFYKRECQFPLVTLQIGNMKSVFGHGAFWTEQVEGQVTGPVDRWESELMIAAWMDGWMVDGCMQGWMAGRCMHGWMDTGMDGGWMHAWMDGQVVGACMYSTEHGTQ